MSLSIPALCIVGPRRAQFDGVMLDIAEGGAFVMMSAQVELHTAISLRFHIPPDVLCQAWGTIVRYRATPDGQGLGIEFADANQGFVHWVRNLGAGLEIERHEFLRDVSDVQLTVG